jgi:hypothetical protein
MEDFMKITFLFTLLLILTFACNNKQKEYPNIENDRLIKQLNWGMNYSSTAKVLTENFKLEFSKELKQGEQNNSARVYEFTGGKYNNIKTDKWVAAFNNDSLQFITIMLAESEKGNGSFFNVLTEKFNTDHISLNSSDEKRWSIEKEGKEFAIMLLKKEGVILISKTLLEN